jgi:endoglucanase
MKNLTAVFAVVLTFLTACSSGSSGKSIPAGYSAVPAISLANKTITSFTVTGARGTINRFDRTVKLYLPVDSGLNLASLAPTITLASGYTISPASGATSDFSSGTVTYTVTKTSDGSTTDYVVSATKTAPDAATVDGWLGRGINLGNDLDAWPGDEGSWTGNVVAKEYFFDDYLSLGFNSVRVPITWGEATNSRLGTSSPYNVSSSFMNRVDTVAGWGIDRGLTVVINAHHEDWIRTKTGSALTAALPRFEALWTQIANHFKDWPPQLVFEILNEPHDGPTAAEINALNSDILAIIRGTGGNNATRAVIIGAISYNSLFALTDGTFTIPSDGATPHLIANFHDYNPWPFAGQSTGTWGSSSDIATATSNLDSVVAWSAANGHIPLYMGEFGATLQYNGAKTDAASRVAWYTNMASLAHDNARNIAAVAWDDYGDFKLYDRVNRAFATSILPALMNN